MLHSALPMSPPRRAPYGALPEAPPAVPARATGVSSQTPDLCWGGFLLAELLPVWKISSSMAAARAAGSQQTGLRPTRLPVYFLTHLPP